MTERLDGTLETDPDALAAFGGDFGRLVTAAPRAVLRPGSESDVVELVRYARRHGLPIAMNGQCGGPDVPESHSNLGQATVPGGVAIDARGLATIHRIEATTAEVGPGVTWAELFHAALEAGLTPPMLPDFLHLSIGGTLSVGGLGGTVHRFGSQADCVTELQVVTGLGELVTCSRSRHADLFDAVLAGMGQCGIIVRATVELVRAEARARVFNLFYDDLATYTADQLRVLDEDRFSFQAGQIVRRPDDSGWRFMMEAAAYYTPPAEADQDALLAGLSDDRASAQIVDLAYPEWAFRLDPLVAALREGGFWDQPHPWVSLFVPASRVVDVVGSMVAQLEPPDVGMGPATFFPFPAARITRPLLVVPRRERAVFALNLLRFPFPDHPDVPGLLAQNRRFFDETVAGGGRRYGIGAIPGMTRGDWARHYGRRWAGFREAKDRYDPDRILTPGPGIF